MAVHNPSAAALCRGIWGRLLARPWPQHAAWKALKLLTASTAWCVACSGPYLRGTSHACIAGKPVTPVQEEPCMAGT